MKVALLTTWEKKCGIADYSSALAKELKKLVELEIVPVKACPEWEQENIDQLAAKLNAYDLIHIQHAYSFFGGTLSRYNKFRELIGKLTKPFVITLHEVYYPLPFIHFQNLRPKIELNLFFKNILFGYTSYRERISLGALKKAARVIVHNRKQAEILLNLGLDEKAVSIVPHGVPSVAQDRPDTADVKAELGLAGKTVLTIFGFINWRKGYELAIEAVSKMPDDIVLLIAGGARVEDDQPNVNSLQALINSKGLQARVRITGYLQPVEVAKYFNATDIVLSPSLSAASSGALALALANGKPIVASDLPVNAEINEIVPCLELFRSGDSRKLSEKIILLLKDEAKRHELSAKADQYAKLWSFANVAKATVKIYSLARVNEVEEITSLIADLSFNEVRHLKSPLGISRYIRIADEISRVMRSGRILDWGSGWGQMSFLLKKRSFEVVSYDVFPSQSPFYKAIGAEIIVGKDPVKLPFPDKSFDGVLSCGVLEHVSDQFGSISEVKRILRNEGTFLIYMLPNKYSYIEWALGLFGKSDHPIKYSKRSIKSILETNGFRLLSVKHQGMLPYNLKMLPDRFSKYYHKLDQILKSADELLSRIPVLNLLSSNLEVIAVKRKESL